ncbi:MAG: alkaline phosphatase family protein [Bacteroides sp.]|nr:alkaline phosphatase family protein [Bacteroides sp.]
MKKGLITSILALTFGGLQAQPLPSAPKLVVTLTIDQLRTDYMEAFSSLYGEKGFKRLLREGKVFRQAEFPFNGTDRASAIATIYTGTTPSMNGIIAERWFNPNTLHLKNCVDDPEFMGNYTDENTSPSQLLTSTFTDELKVATQNAALVYAIAPFRDAAVLSAGHAGNGAFWLNEKTGKWCGTTYYGEYPWWISQYNDQQSPDFRIKEMEWNPLHPITSYTFLPEWRTIPFKYKFDGEKENKYRRLITSPLINDEVNRMAEDLLDKSNISKDDITDVLALTYYAGNYNHRNMQECAMEMQDTYARLDQSIANLLDILEHKVGLQNVLLCITSTGYADPDGADIGIYRIPGGEFYLNRCATLLNMYLMATYGEGQYVEGFYNQQIYLNHKLLENKQLSLAEVQEKSAEFLVQFSGVDKVHSAYRLLLGSWSPQMDRIRNGFHRHRSGDLIIEVLPGWTVMQENSNDNRVVRAAGVPAPLILLGRGIKSEIIRIPVSVDRIAPTLSSVMRIRAPNACTTTPLDF